MKRVFTVLAFALAVTTASAQYHYQNPKNSEMLYHAERHEPCRKELVLPQVNGYTVFKADLHTHTIFSDGLVHPKFRVLEAWQDGLDVYAVTEHIEYRPHEATFYDYLKEYSDKEYLPGTKGLDPETQKVDLNYCVRMSQEEAQKYGLLIIPGTEITRNGAKVGHFNALFTTDNNKIYDADPAQAVRNAKAQGALVMHNHPGWTRENLNMTPTEEIVYGEGLIDGVEIMNGKEFYPGMIDRANEKKIFMSANTDIHRTTGSDFRLTGHDRPMTLILAKEKTLEAIREALESQRTLAFGFNNICGPEQLVKDFFAASVQVKRLPNGEVQLTNLTSVPYIVKIGDAAQFRIDAFSSVKAGASKKATSIKLYVMNMWIGVDSHPTVELPIIQ